jgi:hypothetical protein
MWGTNVSVLCVVLCYVMLCVCMFGAWCGVRKCIGEKIKKYTQYKDYKDRYRLSENPKRRRCVA